MTAERVAEIRALLDSPTPPPWERGHAWDRDECCIIIAELFDEIEHLRDRIAMLESDSS